MAAELSNERLIDRFVRGFGDDARADETFGLVTVDVPPSRWVDALTFARDNLGCAFFDWLSAVDELDEGFSVVAHVYSTRGQIGRAHV